MSDPAERHGADSTNDTLALVPFSFTSPFADLLRLEYRIFSFPDIPALDGNIRIEQRWKEGGKGGSEIGLYKAYSTVQQPLIVVAVNHI